MAQLSSIVTPTLPEVSTYTDKKLQRIQTFPAAYRGKGWYRTPDGGLAPSDFASQLIHLGKERLRTYCEECTLKS